MNSLFYLFILCIFIIITSFIVYAYLDFYNIKHETKNVLLMLFKIGHDDREACGDRSDERRERRWPRRGGSKWKAVIGERMITVNNATSRDRG